MVSNRIKHPWLSGLALFGLFLLIVYLLYLMGYAAQKSERFGDFYAWLLLGNIGLMAVLAIAIIYRFAGIFRDLVTRAEGARLTWRLVLMFVFASLIPVLLVWGFSVRFLTSSIDRWFDVDVEQALSDALTLSQRSLDMRLDLARQKVEQAARELSGQTDPAAGLALNELRQRIGASELNLLGPANRIIATSSVENTLNVPQFPTEHMLVQLSNGNSYVGLEPAANGKLNIRVVSPVPAMAPNAEARLLSAVFAVPERLGALAENVQNAYAEYKSHEFLRRPLKQSIRLTLSLVLLLSTLFALWAALYMAGRLLEPIYELATATRAVAKGDYQSRLPVVRRDELGFLVQSFNAMTERIRQARDAAALSQELLEGQRSYLQAVLGHLSTGVLTLDNQLRIHTANEAADHLLETREPLESQTGQPIDEVAKHNPVFSAFYEQLSPELSKRGEEWSREVTLFGDYGRKVLICHGVPLPGSGDEVVGQVIVIDDVTSLIKAQRDAAWSEVARRLAHEIKNPLTPIQLSAERLAHKLKDKLPPEQQQVLERSTRTIVKQVDAMQGMVNTFRDYASTPRAQYAEMDLNQLIHEVAELYAGYRDDIKIRTRLDPDLPRLVADASRLRQVLHNLIGNALDAIGEQPGTVTVSTAYMESDQGHYVELRIRDTGEGIPDSIRDQLFEPYVTSKPKGTGLGLAIVLKIVEEHGGMVSATNPPEGGAEIVIRLPEKSAHGQ